MSFGAIAVAILLFLVPAIPSWEGDPDRELIAQLSVPSRSSLLVVYVVVTFVLAATPPRAAHRERRGDRGLALPALASSSWRPRRSSPRSSPRSSSARSRCSPRRSGLSEFFVAAVIVAIVGNAAEHGGAVVVAYRGKVKLAAEIALASAAQVAVFLIPAVALLSWLIDPLGARLPPGRDRGARVRRWS